MIRTTILNSDGKIIHEKRIILKVAMFDLYATIPVVGDIHMADLGQILVDIDLIVIGHLEDLQNEIQKRILKATKDLNEVPQ